ncbi:MAG: SLC26A/SulP transporter family protein [Rubrivivax sp.]|nr:SLC26A/SulP transporter family protein [Rubrivivax sp.]
MSTLPTRWRPGLGDLVGGTTAALVLMPIYGSLGVLALAPLGPGFVSLGFVLGVLAAALGNVTTLLAGDRGTALCAPVSATALLVPGLLLTLMARPGFQRSDGTPDAALLLLALAAALLLAGALQWALGRLRLSAAIRYVPYPVHAGFMLGVAVLMVSAMWPRALGLGPGQPLVPALTMLGPLSVALLCAWLVIWPPRWLGPVPGVLAALLAGSALHHATVHGLGPAWGGATLGPLHLQWPGAAWMPRLADPAVPALLLATAGPLVLWAAVMAVTAALQTLMAHAALDLAAGRRGDSESLARGHGIANAVGGLLGLISVSTAASYASLSQRAGAVGSASRLAHAGTLVLGLGAGAGLLAQLPMPVIAGIFFALAWSLVDRWSRQTLADAARALRRWRWPPAAQRGPLGVMLLVAGVSVQVSLVIGITLGSLLAVLQFVRSHIRAPVRRVIGADRQPSHRVRPAAAAAWLRAQGHRIVLVTLDGPLFFGTADAAARAIQQQAALADEVVLDFRRVPELDASGARVLLQAATELRMRGRRLLLAGLSADDPRAQHLLAMDPAGLLVPESFQPDADRAIEQAEDRLLAADGLLLPAAEPLSLAQTQLGAALDAAARERLAAVLGTRQVLAGEGVFRRGEPGDALFLLRSGQVAITLPAARGGRRLVSYAPGVVFGEIGLLRGTPRTADAVAETDAELWVLDRAAHDRLLREDPVLMGQLLRQLALQLSDRLAALTLTLEALDDAPAASLAASLAMSPAAPPARS